jgi:hypothetical protein
MSLFDMVKGKAAELLTGASDKVSELTGIDLPGGEIAEQLTASADGLAGAGQEAVGTVTEAGQNLADTAGAAGDAATGTLGAVTDAVDPRPGS